MNRRGLVIGSVVAVLLAAIAFRSHSAGEAPAGGAIPPGPNWHPPSCPHGYEPGGGPIRCADPDNPSSYLYKKAHAPKTSAAANDGQVVSADGKEIITPDGKHWARRPDWMPTPQQDPRFCVRATAGQGASALNRCVQIQRQEFLPSTADYQNALRNLSDYLQRTRRAQCIDDNRRKGEMRNCD